MAAEGGGIADDEKLHAGASHGNVHPAEVAQETDVALLVAPYKRDDNYVALLPLKSVNRVD